MANSEDKYIDTLPAQIVTRKVYHDEKLQQQSQAQANCTWNNTQYSSTVYSIQYTDRLFVAGEVWRDGAVSNARPLGEGVEREWGGGSRGSEGGGREGVIKILNI